MVFGAYVGVRRVYFLGTDEAGLVTIYRGVPYELPFGLNLFSEQYASSVLSRSLGKARRERLLDHEWRSRADAEDWCASWSVAPSTPAWQPVSARTREMLGLIPVALIVSAGFGGVT